MAESCSFDPARDGFGFHNPVGWVPERTGGGGSLLRRFDAFVYGKGLCFGMVAAALLNFHAVGRRHPQLVDCPLTRDLLDVLRECQLRQFWPQAILKTVRDWVASGGGRPGGVLGRVRLVGTSADPHILCFGPALNRRFLSCFARAHAVLPYRIEQGRLYVYDPNHPRDREKFVEFRNSGEFTYGGFSSREGWGITLVPLSVVRPAALDRLLDDVL